MNTDLDANALSVKFEDIAPGETFVYDTPNKLFMRLDEVVVPSLTPSNPHYRTRGNAVSLGDGGIRFFESDYPVSMVFCKGFTHNPPS